MILTKKYAPSGTPMPVAIVIGADQLSTLVAGAGYRIGESEVEFAGALAQEPIELVKCETSDLLVPAHAEIVIEGEILTNVTQVEGPFGEYTGYRGSPGGDGLVCRVKAVTHRNSPIVTMVSLGTPVDEATVSGTITMAMTYKRRFKRLGLPITDVCLPLEGACHVVVVGVKTGGKDTAIKIRDALASRRIPLTKIIVVDEDVDVFNFGEVLHAMATKCHSIRGITLTEHPGKGNPLTPCYTFEERIKQDGATALLDCTWPKELRIEDRAIKSSFNTIYPNSVRQKVMENWKNYGFK
jgi:4-hydroxy-3-polyprenylbenzoate decarboxylase